MDKQLAVGEFHGAEAHLEVDIFVKADEVLNSGEDGLEGVIDDVFAHLAGRRNGDGVSIDGFETFLVDRLLTAGVDDLFLAVVAV